MYLVSDHMVMLNLLVEQIVQRSRYFVNNGCSFMIATTDSMPYKSLVRILEQNGITGLDRGVLLTDSQESSSQSYILSLATCKEWYTPKVKFLAQY